MRTIANILMITLLLSACGEKRDQFKISDPPYQLCSSVSDVSGIVKEEGADFHTIAWGPIHNRVLIYVGHNPDFPGMKEIYQKEVAADEVSLLGERQFDGASQRIYGFKDSDGHTAYALVTVNGSPDMTKKQAKEIGDGLGICKIG